MPRKSRFFSGGFIDILSLVAVVFLVITTITGAVVINKQNANFDLRNKAMVSQGDGSGSISNTTSGTSKTINPTPFCSKTCTGNQYCKPDTNGGSCVTDVAQNTTSTTPVVTQTTPTQTISYISDGVCLGPGQTCQNGNYFDSACATTETRCGTKPAQVAQNPVPTPYCSRTCSGNQYCSPDLNGGSCVTDIPLPTPTTSTSMTSCTPGKQQCSGVLLQTCNSDGKSWSSNNCGLPGCNPSTNSCNPTTPTSCTTYGGTCQPNTYTCEKTYSYTNCKVGEICGIHCVGTHKVGDVQCVGSGLETWNGTSWNIKHCDYGCENNACKSNPNPLAALNDIGLPSGLSGNSSIPIPQSAVTSQEGFQQYASTVGSGFGAGLGTGALALGGAVIIPEAITGIAATNAVTGGGLATLPTATYSYITAALATNPVLQTAAAVATLSQGPLAVILCQTQGANSPACQMAAMGITASYQMDPIGTEQALQASYQQVQFVTQSGIANVKTATTNAINNLTDPFGDTSDFRLTNAPTMNGPSLTTSIEDNSYLMDGDPTFNSLLTEATGGKYTDVNDPEFIIAMINDNAIIRQKYNLPPTELQRNYTGEYVKTITNQIEQSGRQVTDIRNYETFRQDYPRAGGINDPGDLTSGFGSVPFIAVDPSIDITAQANTLTHEYIHAMQTINYPGMPIETMEYEAYIGSLRNPINLLDGGNRNYILGGWGVAGSSTYFNNVNGMIKPWMTAITP